MERLSKERGSLPVCSEYLQALLELVYMLRAKNNQDSSASASGVLASIEDINHVDDDSGGEKTQSSSSSSTTSSSSEPFILEVPSSQQQKMGQEGLETVASAQGPGLAPLTPKGVPQLEGRQQPRYIDNPRDSLLVATCYANAFNPLHHPHSH